LTCIKRDPEALSLEKVAWYGVDLPPGSYWYDHVSGPCGVEGGAPVGQIIAGLPLGGPPQADASLSDSVFINGREIEGEAARPSNLPGAVDDLNS